MIKVSVIVPVYNVERYLDKCLSSLVNQTLEEIEIIVVNDGSTDTSQSIIDEFYHQYPAKIKPYTKENGGLSDARNFGIDRASGRYIAFVDSDDYVSETMMEDLYNLGEKHNADITICNIQKVDENGTVTQKLTQIPNMPEKIILREHFSVFSDLSYFACNKIFRKELFEGNRFKKGAHFEDIQLIPQLLLKSTVVAQTQKFHYQYLERQDSITKTHTERGLDILKAVEDVEKAFAKSQYKYDKKALENFCILEGVYTFLAYLAFVRDDKIYREMSSQLRRFRDDRNLNLKKILFYKRFGKNYLVSLYYKKKIYYLLYFFHQYWILRKILK
ncbi:glycosyltransferase family 2 protein [Riemerella columbipharyngis]|uniref:Glycosyltransferase involved in cell wall bisynthesis n=1 Tax=Riemerella columbipharyngis TaxID=1071918 RepID=A0A1G7ELX5_9FLAO|nr:glycosyltransferase [Riemerella columbipharyngis]SDE64456.1 Glycosyltransferase involved in cell wall bisynthesis [Riemerella columbipharyngis]